MDGQDEILITLDGSGDNENATVWKYANGKYENLVLQNFFLADFIAMQHLY